MSQEASSHPPWWQTATIYEIYPSSFKDSNSDGIGDIPGIISKIPYLVSLGINAVWLAACHRSGGVDMGYDVINYREIDPQYGTVADIERLIAELGKVGIKLIMDMVLNHTSDQHPWFLESRRSKENEKRDWFIWRKGKTGKSGELLPPNNWESIFTGSAWTYDSLTDEYYLRIFSQHQPDLNWSNPSVRAAIFNDMRFWLDKGVAGFRLDVINMISKPSDLENRDAKIVNPGVFDQPAYGLYCNGSRVHEYLREMRSEVLDLYSNPERMTVGEVIVTSKPEDVRMYVEPERKELNMAYQYDLFDVDSGPNGKFSACLSSKEEILSKLKDIVTKWQTQLAFSKGGSQNAIWLESHDTARSVSRFGDGIEVSREKVAKMLALLQTTLSGTLFVYQGQELGLTNLSKDIPISRYPDVETKKAWEACYQSRLNAATTTTTGKEVDMSDFEEQVRLKARDHARMPLPWKTSAPNAGFSDVEEGQTWSPMNTTLDAARCNIEKQDSDPDSVLNFWRKQIRFRQDRLETLIFGDFEVVDEQCQVFAYWKKAISRRNEGGGRDVLVVLNLTGDESVKFKLPAIPGVYKHDGQLAMYTWLGGTDESGRVAKQRVVRNGTSVVLGAYEGAMLGY